MSEKAGAPDQPDPQLHADANLLTAFMVEQKWSLNRMVTACLLAATTPGIALIEACPPEKSGELLGWLLSNISALAKAWTAFEPGPPPVH